MVVYGVALLSFCMLAGVFLGQLLGYLLGIDANVGGIGIAMLLLILIANKKSMTIKIDASTKSGINFWNAMYIPIVVAMAAKQNVLAAISGGWMAIQPPEMAASTFCFAAIATTIGMYMAFQKLIPDFVLASIFIVILFLFAMSINSNIAMPIPPTLASIPSK